MTTLKTLIVDDEALARSRMRTLLRECTSPAAEVVAEASQGAEAQTLTAGSPERIRRVDLGKSVM